MADTQSFPGVAAPGGPKATVILGGFLSHPSFYTDMKERIEALSGSEARIVPVSPSFWPVTAFPRGWKSVLNRLDRALGKLQELMEGVQVTLVGHSIGGVLGRLYLHFPAAVQHGWQRQGSITRLVTLGSPHINRRRWTHGGQISRTAEYWARTSPIRKNVDIICIAGKKILGNRRGNFLQRRALAAYKRIGGEGEVWGDGIIPVESALLPGANHIVLEDAAHYSPSGGAWYGKADVVSRWWRMIDSV